MKTTSILKIALIIVVICHEGKAQNSSEDANNVPITGTYNSAFGIGALAASPQGSNNSAFGYQSQGAALLGDNNTSSGAWSLFTNLFGYDNTSSGYFSMYNNVNGNYNVGLGAYSLFSNNGNFNTAIGDSALYSNAFDNNTAVGASALFSNANGIENAAVGMRALYKNTSGSGNTAHGFVSLYSNTSGMYNTAVGDSALYSNTTGSMNIAVGNSAMRSNTSGWDNIGIGVRALSSNISGNQNIAIGEEALYFNTLGFWNTAVGVGAATSNSVGIRNCAFGHACMQNNSSHENSAFGAHALFLNEGFQNTVVGYDALSSNITGHDNSGIGSRCDVSTATLTNASVFGANAVVNASDKIRLGDANVTVIEGQVAYTFPSDGRFKTNIKDEVQGLEFIKRLRPVVYNFDTKKFDQFLSKNMPDSIKKERLNKDYSKSTAIRQSGFIAQEVEKVANEIGYNFNGVHKPNDDGDNYSLAYELFVVPLVKAVQEQQQMIEEKDKKLEEVEAKLQELTKTVEALKAQTTGIAEVSAAEGFFLGQNEPNPFTLETNIRYALPKNINSAYLAVYDLSGKQLVTFALDKNSSSVIIDSKKLAAGIYIYSVVADHKILDSKRMVVAEK